MSERAQSSHVFEPPAVQLYRVNVEGGGTFLYDTVDVGRFAMRMAREDDRPFTVTPEPASSAGSQEPAPRLVEEAKIAAVNPRTAAVLGYPSKPISNEDWVRLVEAQRGLGDDQEPAPAEPVCHEEVTRDEVFAPCELPAVGVREDPNHGGLYPVCWRHLDGARDLVAAARELVDALPTRVLALLPVDAVPLVLKRDAVARLLPPVDGTEEVPR